MIRTVFLVGVVCLLAVMVWVAKQQDRKQSKLVGIGIVEAVEPAIGSGKTASGGRKTATGGSIIIADEHDLRVITDEKLRQFVTRNAVFGRDKVLYFEWHGGEADAMQGTTTSDLETKDKRYMISLRTDGGSDLLHRQVFIVPRTYTYEVEISK